MHPLYKDGLRSAPIDRLASLSDESLESGITPPGVTMTALSERPRTTPAFARSMTVMRCVGDVLDTGQTALDESGDD
ncbi:MULTISPECIES: hypothetical protein [unclassified Natrinema]|uniref:hypothetical protein n=1 Tax=unclassified Natrinema TaxID=2622230 RepID=UPI00026D44BE|nr:MULTISPECIES: hypothetical protein [unclassified Natrinema]AFO58993.1 hypothetical protein NJ7G_3776 [Natrinema sp. J7-2]